MSLARDELCALGSSRMAHILYSFGDTLLNMTNRLAQHMLYIERSLLGKASRSCESAIFSFPSKSFCLTSLRNALIHCNLGLMANGKDDMLK